MILFVDTLLVLMILSAFLLLGSSRLGACIRFVAFQGFLVGLFPLVVGTYGPSLRVVIIALVIVASKGIAFPVLLSRALRESETNREVQPFVGYGLSLLFGLVSLVVSFQLDKRLGLPPHYSSDLVVPVSFFMMMGGLFLIVARKTAVNQVVGYLVLENGISVFGLALVRDIPVLIEMGVLMDVFVAVLVMGIAIYRINREFDHIDSDRLNQLKG